MSIILGPDTVRVYDVEVHPEEDRLFFCLETWFDVDEKFGLHTRDNDNEWVNLYADYYPYTGRVDVIYEHVADYPPAEYGTEDFDYAPTEEECRLLTAVFNDCCRQLYNQSPAEMLAECADEWDDLPVKDDPEYGPSNPWDAPGMTPSDFVRGCSYF